MQFAVTDCTYEMLNLLLSRVFENSNSYLRTDYRQGKGRRVFEGESCEGISAPMLELGLAACLVLGRPTVSYGRSGGVVFWRVWQSVSPGSKYWHAPVFNALDPFTAEGVHSEYNVPMEGGYST